MKKALLVIDMQNICVGKESAVFFKYDKNQLIESVNNIIQENRTNEVIFIRNIMKKSILNKFAPFKAYEGTTAIELIDELEMKADNIFDKYEGDAFTNKELDIYLKDKQVDTVEVVGVDGGGCVALTAMGAIKKGYNVIVNTKAIGTMFDKNQKKFFNKLIKEGAQIIK